MKSYFGVFLFALLSPALLKGEVREIGNYRFIPLAEFSSITEIPQELYSDRETDNMMVICDKNDVIASFDGQEVEDGLFFSEQVNELCFLMTKEDNTKTYIRNFNGNLQVWTMDDLDLK